MNPRLFPPVSLEDLRTYSLTASLSNALSTAFSLVEKDKIKSQRSLQRQIRVTETEGVSR